MKKLCGREKFDEMVKHCVYTFTFLNSWWRPFTIQLVNFLAVVNNIVIIPDLLRYSRLSVTNIEHFR